MRYLKALGIGLLSAVSAAALYLAVKSAWVTLHLAAATPPTDAESPSSWDVYYPTTFDLRGPLVLGFAIGFWWVLQRSRRVRPH